jgi:hypothetical protein
MGYGTYKQVHLSMGNMYWEGINDHCILYVYYDFLLGTISSQPKVYLLKRLPRNTIILGG